MTNENIKIILASKSPRRKQILEQMELDFEVRESLVEEVVDSKMGFGEVAETLAEQKARDVFDRTLGNRVVIGADTIVVFNNSILCKPQNVEEAQEMLTSLQGNKHTAITGLAVFYEKDGEEKVFKLHDSTTVFMSKLKADQIDGYIRTGDCFDKAGAYAVQGVGGKFIEKIEGNFYTVMGLPVHKLYEILYSLNIME